MAAAKDTATAPVIDITKHGYFKLLGKGQLPQQPVVVRAKFVSKLAEKKIKEVGAAPHAAVARTPWCAPRLVPVGSSVSGCSGARPGRACRRMVLPGGGVVRSRGAMHLPACFAPAGMEMALRQTRRTAAAAFRAPCARTHFQCGTS